MCSFYVLSSQGQQSSTTANGVCLFCTRLCVCTRTVIKLRTDQGILYANLLELSSKVFGWERKGSTGCVYSMVQVASYFWEKQDCSVHLPLQQTLKGKVVLIDKFDTAIMYGRVSNSTTIISSTHSNKHPLDRVWIILQKWWQSYQLERRVWLL